MRITAKKLRAKGACEPDIEAFEKQWPKGCNVTRENCRIAFRASKMSVMWAAENLLSEGDFQSVINASGIACGECERRNRCENPSYCAFDKATIEAFYQAAKG